MKSDDDGSGPHRETAPSPDTASASGFVEIASGLLFALAGAGALWVGGGYAMGTAVNMGPGYLPRAVAWGLVMVGLASFVRGAVKRKLAAPELVLRPILWITLAIFVFAMTIERFGVAISGVATVAIAAAAQANARWREVPAIAIGLAVFCVLLFGYALNLSIPVWPR
jgi:Tripartite tricarboxylate transporter TctB family